MSTSISSTTARPASALRSPSSLTVDIPSYRAPITATPSSQLDTLSSMSPNSPVHSGLRCPQQTSLIMSIGSAILGMIGGFSLATYKRLDLVGRLAFGFAGALIFYSISLLPSIVSRLKNSSERFWAAIDLSTWGLTIIQKMLTLTTFIPKIAANATRLLAFSIASSSLSFLTFILSAITSARTTLAVYDVKHLHELQPLNAETLSKFISERSRIRWVLEEFATSRADDLNRLIQEDPVHAAKWIKKVTKGALIFSSLSALSQTLGATSVILGFVGGGVVGVPMLMASTVLFFLSWVAQTITARYWMKELPKVVK